MPQPPPCAIAHIVCLSCLVLQTATAYDSHLFGLTDTNVTASAASYQYNMEAVSLQAQQISNCAYLHCSQQCNRTSHFGDFAFETTFTCNPSPTPSKHHDSYSSTRDEDTSLFDAAHQRISAGSCVWSLASYDTRPVLVSAPGASNNRVYRFGDVHATCSLNNQAERCGMPGCERMVLSLQGFVYLTNVRSSSPTAGFHYNTANLGVNEEPVCCVLDERLNIINNEAACYNIRRSPLQRSFFPTAMQEWRRNETLKQQSAAAAAAAAGGTDTSSSSNIAAAAATAAAAAAANTKAHPDGYEGQLPSVEYDKVEGDDIQIGLMNKFSGDSYDSYGSYGYHTSEGPLYVGEALIFQGTSRMTIVAEKGQGRVVERSGQFEFAFFTDLSLVNTPTAAEYRDYHPITPQSLKLSFPTTKQAQPWEKGKEYDSQYYYQGGNKR